MRNSIVFRFGILFSFFCFWSSGCKPSVSSSGKQNSDLDFPVGTFELTERSGKTLKNTDLEGKVWIGSFIFTRCTGPCPQITATIARLQKELLDEKEVRFVTFTVDPTRDNPDELKQYAKHFQADPDKWLFLTGKEDVIHQLLTENFKVSAFKNPKAKEVSDEFDHSTKLMLVDKKGIIRAYFDGMPRPNSKDNDQLFEDELKKLKKKVKELIEE